MNAAARNGKPALFGDDVAARVALQVATSRRKPDDGTLNRLPWEWREGVLLAEQDGTPGIDEWLRVERARDPQRAEAMRRAIELAEADPGPVDVPAATAGPAGFDLALIDSATFFAERYVLEWLVKGTLVKDQPCVFGGPQKSLKTSILIDLAVSLGSRTPFLGRFDVPQVVRVALISGESGRFVIQANAREICRARDVGDPTLLATFWGFALPQLTSAEQIEVLIKTIRDRGLGCIILDPFYLTILAGNAGIDPKDMFQMGPLLADVAAACSDAGATPVLAHHFIKKRDDPFGPPDMGELAYSGIGQFMRQWMLIARSERFDAEAGVHKLHFHFGGSAGHAGEYALEIQTGVIDEDFAGRKWLVSISRPSEDRAAKQEQQQAARSRRESERAQEKEAAAARTLEKNAAKVAEAIGRLAARGEAATKTAISEEAALNRPTAGAALAVLRNRGAVEVYTAKVPTGTGSRDADAYRMVTPGGPASC
jgi:hypothetical protein